MEKEIHHDEGLFIIKMFSALQAHVWCRKDKMVVVVTNHHSVGNEHQSTQTSDHRTIECV